MKFDRKFLVNAHNDIKADMAAIGLEPHHSLQHLMGISKNPCTNQRKHGKIKI